MQDHKLFYIIYIYMRSKGTVLERWLVLRIKKYFKF